jgi:hypothetical protein
MLSTYSMQDRPFLRNRRASTGPPGFVARQDGFPTRRSTLLVPAPEVMSGTHHIVTYSMVEPYNKI